MYYNNSGGNMKEIIDTFVTNSTAILSSYGPIAGIIMIVLESIIPALPLSVFITLNMVAFGNILGFIISWLSTIAGCMISFFLFRKLFRNRLEKYVKKKNSKQLNKIMYGINNITFSNLVILIAIPFSPASWINVGAALSKIKTKEFFWAVVLGKIVMVYFWGYIGTSLLDSLTDINILFKIGFLLVIAYILSKLVEDKLKIK